MLNDADYKRELVNILKDVQQGNDLSKANKTDQKRISDLLDAIESKGPEWDRSKPACYDKVMGMIRDVGEKALQRAIWRSKTSELSGTLNHIVWADMELPVDISKSARRKCVDLVGLIDDKVILCELKFAKQGDSPRYGILELIVYHYLARLNPVKLDQFIQRDGKPDSNKFGWSKLSDVLIFAANKEYWQYWQQRYNKSPAIQEWFDDVQKKLNLQILLYQIDIATDYFEKLRNKRENYIPEFDSNPSWGQVRLIGTPG